MVLDTRHMQLHKTWPPRIRIVAFFEELYKEKYGDFPNPVKNCPFAPQESICSHVSKSGV